MGYQENTSFHSRSAVLCCVDRRMDYRQFLQRANEVLTLPYFGGKSVCDDKRTYRLRETLVPGWYRFRKSGRYLTEAGAVEAELHAWELPRVTGYVLRQRIVGMDFQTHLFGLPTDLELPQFTPVTGRKWFDGHILYDGLEFETEVDAMVRDAFEEERSIEQIKGVTPALAHAFMLESTQRALAREAQRRAQEERQRRAHAAELARWQETLEGRIVLALSHAGAELVSWRRGGRRQAVVRYRLGGRRFECIIDTETLQILDAGICLEGADEQLNLSSLPSAVREAIAEGSLHVYRHA
jgi:hypothetical protein